jgi:NitT/TauT family transport system permease protein
MFSACCTIGMILSIWWLVSAVYGHPKLLPGPVSVASVFVQNANGLTRLTAVSGLRAVLGLSAAAVAAAFLTAVLALWPCIGRFVYPVAILLKATPAVAVAPILLVLVGSGWSAKIIIVALIAFFPMVVTSVDSLGHVPAELRLIGRAYGASRFGRCRHIESGWLIYGFASGLRTGAPLAVVGAIVAEFVDSTSASELGLGVYLFSNARLLFMDQVFAAALVSGLLGLSLFGFCTFLVRRAATNLHLRIEN